MILGLVAVSVLALLADLLRGWGLAVWAAAGLVLAAGLYAWVHGTLLGNPFQAGLVMSAGVIFAARFYAWRPRLRPFVRYAYALALFLTLASLHYADRVGTPLPVLLVVVHAGSFLVAYVALTIAFVAGLLGVLQDRTLRVAPWRARFIPPLVTLRRLELPYLRVGYVAYTAGAFTGMAWAWGWWGSALSWDPKEVATLATWSLLTLYLLARGGLRWSGRLGAWLLVYGMLLFTFLGAPLLGGRHPS
ncbi:cytochrome c biogenesis protein CcsA [Marinithermus hydrothermalis]|uniref:Cytochrome c assembly protein n=1 Tax=Marinithermus hydrothermalis (strain DSM 14884 / JCM 11576 / T1) TaxID=869210 RepID=F2NMN4_MARHT|nr:cytochrome c biogenesis protein CcsA [Marinithermus hydrothermalis]AEB12418.1 cytochrome c assembly protein [Marinithermus hydrothermalis DSM 14884]